VGFDFRRASGEACNEFGRILENPLSAKTGNVRREGPIVEAFPNAFPGVLTPEA
jgi:hypothetical protein